MNRNVVQIANPRRHGETRLNRRKAQEYCARGEAYWLRDGRLRFRESDRRASDVYVDRRGVIFWNGARSRYINGQDVAMFPPCRNVVYPKVGTKRAALRMKGAA